MDTNAADWQTLCADHRRAAAAFASRASSVPDSDWSRQPAPGRWSPGQITEHLVKTYEAALRELSGEPGMRVRTRLLQRLLIRFRFLPTILKGGRIPPGAQAVRELRPPDEPRGREALTDELRRLADRFDAEFSRAAAAGTARLTHPIFGVLGARDALRFMTVHIEHHGRQIT